MCIYNINKKWVINLKIQDWKHVKIKSVYPLYLIFSKVNGNFEETHKNKYLMLVPINESKEIIKKKMNNCGIKSEI